MGRPKVYLAGPMTHYPHFNFPEFLHAEIQLESQGYRVYSPARHDLDNGFNPEKSLEENNYDLESAFRWDIKSVLKSDMVVVLDGWQDSVGASIEVSVARACGIPVCPYTSEWPYVGTPIDFDEQPEENVLQEAERLVYGPRQACYGHPADDFARTAAMWSVILGTHVEPEQVGLCQIALKISREVNAHKRDNLVDIAGYAGTVALVRSREWND